MVDWGRVEAVFSEAVELEGDARAAFLDRECEGDVPLKREVERLLRSLESAGTFLAKPLLRVDTEVLPPAEAAPLQRLGQLVGDYKLVNILGRGGMGVVYLAMREGEFERKVALKLIEGWAPPALIERFERERQLLAGLEHPFIARMYEGGTTEDNQPYLVMEHVDGLPLEQYCQDQRLSVSRRLKLFLKVCAGVAYAHRNLLVHRDLKPSNILVTAEGVPKLLDFGIAKSLDPEAGAGMTTTQGPSPMTLAYASPEQVRGETISTASDVYSLGVVLFKLMAGRFPYREMEDSFELGKEIVDGDVPRPSMSATAPGELKGDLDAITLKALRKEPDQRYPSVGALSEDIKSYLEHRPVLAREGALTYRLRKFVRRNRLAVAAGVIGALVLVGFIAALIRQTQIANRQRDRAELTRDAFINAFKSSDPETARGHELTARAILDQGADKVRQDLASEPDLLATLLAAIGEVYVSLGLFHEAEPLLHDAHELRREAGVDVGLSLYQFGELEWSRRDYRAAEGYYRNALKLFSEETIEHARCLRGLGLALVWLGQVEEGEALLHKALGVLEDRFFLSDPEILRVVEGLAWIARDQGNYSEAEELLTQLVDVRRTTGPGPALGRNLADLGIVHYRQGDLDKARTLIEEALPMLRKAMRGDNTYVAEVLGKLVPVLMRLGDDKSAERTSQEILKILPEDHPGTSAALYNLGLILIDQGEVDEAERIAKEALRLNRQVFGDKHENVALNLCLLGGIALKRGDALLARQNYDECAAVMRSVHPANHPQLAFAWLGLGWSMELLEGCGAAVSWYRQGYEVRQMGLGRDHFLTAVAAGRLGRCLGELNEDEEAEKLLLRSWETIKMQGFPEDDRRVKESLERLKAFYRARGMVE